MAGLLNIEMCFKVVLVPKYVMEGLLVIAVGEKCESMDDPNHQADLANGVKFLKDKYFCQNPKEECLYDIKLNDVQHVCSTIYLV